MKDKKTYNNLPEQDAFFRDAFKDFEAPYNERSWADLSEKLDRLDSMVPLQDEDFKADLVNLQAPYSPGSWDMLEQKLQLQDDRKKWLLRGKVAELLIFFLAFYLMSGVWDQPFSEGLIPKQDPPALATDHTYTGETNIQNDKFTATKEVQAPEQWNKENNKTDHSIAAHSQTIGKYSAQHAEPKVRIPGHDLMHDAPVQAEPEHNSGIHSETATASPPHANVVLQDHQDLTEDSPMSIVKSETDHIQLDKIPMSLSSIETNASSLESWTMPVLDPRRFAQQKFHVFVGVMAGYDKDLIKSPFPHQLSEVMLGRIEDNFRLGLNLGLDMDYVELHTGVHWLIKRYKSVYSGVNQVRITNIPLMLKIKLPLAGFMRGYVTGGVSANYVAHANYQEHQYFRDRPDLDYIENNSRAKGISLLSTSSYQNGILEGETFKGNHFYTANIGIGLEANLNKKYSLFFEQSYSHHLKGNSIGPAFDHFFSSTSMAGIRYKF